MRRSYRLRLGDVRAVFRLIGEVRELGADWRQWRPHMLSELGRLTGARLVSGAETGFPVRLVDERPALAKVVDAVKDAPLPGRKFLT